MTTALRQILLSKPPEIPSWLKRDLVSFHSGGHRDGVYYPLNQLVANGNFANGDTGVASVNTTVSVIDGICESRATAQFGVTKFLFPMSPNKKYYLSARVLSDSASVTLRAGDDTSYSANIASHTGNGTYRLLSAVVSYSAVNQAKSYVGIMDGRPSGWTDVLIDYFFVCELSDTIGLNNEPAAPEMDAILAADGTAYWDGTRNVLCNPNQRYYWYDYSGRGRHMHMTNLAYTGTSNLDGYGFNVDGVDDYGSIADSVDTRLTQGGTLMAWIKPRTLGEVGTGGRIFEKSTDALFTGGYGLFIATDNTLRCRVNASAETVSILNAITIGKFQLAVLTFSSAGRRLYINAVNVTDTGGAENGLPPDVAIPITIGNRSGFTDRTFDGQIDKPRIIKRVLSQAELYQIFNNERRFYGV